MIAANAGGLFGNSIKEITANNIVSQKRPFERVTKQSIEQMVSKLGRKEEITKVHPHRFQVTKITVLADRGMPLQDVQEIAGHSDIDTTRYTTIIFRKN